MNVESVADLNPFIVLVIGAIAYIVGGAVYRLCFSPIAGFPGPKLAALTYWYEFYYDVIKDGQYIFKIEELHKEYGLSLTTVQGGNHPLTDHLRPDHTRLSG
jgi:hypothetical protein